MLAIKHQDNDSETRLQYVVCAALEALRADLAATPYRHEDWAGDNADMPRQDIEDFLAATGALIMDFQFSECVGRYHPLLDVVGIRSRAEMKSAEHYYEVCFHELIHWTGSGHRIGRPGVMECGAVSVVAGYREEITACLGAVMLSFWFGISRYQLLIVRHHIMTVASLLNADPATANTAWLQDCIDDAEKAVRYLLDLARQL